MNSIISKVVMVYHILKRISINKIFSKWSKNSACILWIPTDGFFNCLRYFFGSSQLVADASILNYLIENEKNYRIVFGSKQIGTLTAKNIFYRAIQLNWFSFYNYVSTSHNILSNLQKQGNELYPPLKDFMYWENKAFMHKKFDEMNVNQPLTKIINTCDIINKDEIQSFFKYPFLIKEIHSAASQGIYKINNYNDFRNICMKIKNKGGDQLLVQELIQMRKDLRVIIVGEEIILNYWRINKSDEWKPTSTSHGSKTDFNSFPNHWEEHVIKIFKKTGLTTGAFDITWNNDDTSSSPLFLELSPFYQANPKPPKKYSNIPYYQYKNIKFGEGNYFNRYVKTSFQIQNKVNQLFRKKIGSNDT